MKTELLKKLGRINAIPAGWKFTTVGKVCKIRNDLRKPLSTEERSKIQGAYPYYGPTGVLDFIDHHLVEGQFALIGEDGDHFLKPKQKAQTLLVDGKFNVNNHAHLIEGTDECSSEWFFLYFHHRDITHLISRQGASRYKLNKDILSKLPILVPPLNEQLKIYKLFTSWDNAIEKTEALIAAKEKQFEWLCTNLLSKRKKSLGFLGKSIPTAFENIFSLFKKVNTSCADYEVLSVTKDGIVSQSEYFNKEIASKDKSKYLVVDKYTLVMSGLNFWMGAIDFQTIRDTGIVSPAYKTFKINEGPYSRNYLRFFVRSHYMTRILLDSSIQGASIVRRNLDMEWLLSSLIDLPNLQEQNAIASILSLAEKEIDGLKLLAEKYRSQKRGLMQKLLTGEWQVASSQLVAEGHPREASA
jgi:type I restriction enzyme S subunit